MAASAEVQPIAQPIAAPRPVRPDRSLIRSRRSTFLGGALVLTALAVGTATFAVLTGLTPIAPTQQVVLGAAPLGFADQTVNLLQRPPVSSLGRNRTGNKLLKQRFVGCGHDSLG